MDNYSLKEIEKMDFETISEVYPDCIDYNKFCWDPKDTKEQFIKSLEILKNMNFTRFWEENCLPILNRQVGEYDSVLKEKSVDNILADINRLKPKIKLNDINIYIDYFSYGMSCQLSPTAYLTNFAANDKIEAVPVLRFFAHELLHGVINEKIKDMYTNTCKSDKLLIKTLDFQFNVWDSQSNEEEFVVALEHYVSFKNGLMTKDEAYKSIYHYYNNSMPVAVIVFDEIVKLGELPEDINSWIYDLFAYEIIKSGEIESKVNEVLPGIVDNFEIHWLIRDDLKKRKYN